MEIHCVLGLEELILLKWTTAQGNLQIECSAFQNTNAIFHKTRASNLKICVKTWKTLNRWNSLEKEQNWRTHAPWHQTTLQSYSNQNNMVLVQKQMLRSMEWNSEPRNKPMHLSSINLWQKKQEYTIKSISSISGTGETRQLHAKEWSQNVL